MPKTDNLKNVFAHAKPAFLAFVPHIVLILAVFAAYANVYGNQFIFDDERLITGNLFLRGGHSLRAMLTMSTNSGSGTISNFYRPLQILIYYLIYQSGHVGPVAFHLLNVALHAANAALMFALGRKLKFNPTATFLAALLWALHPIHTEAVTYMSGTADPLFVCLTLIGLLVLLPDFAWPRVAVASVLFILALLSKEAAVVFPALATVTLFFVRREIIPICSAQKEAVMPAQAGIHLPKVTLERREQEMDPCLRRGDSGFLCKVARTLPLWIIAAIYIVLHLTVLDFQAADLSFDNTVAAHQYATQPLLRIYTCLATLPFYLALLVYPVGLHLERQFPVYVDPTNWAVIIGAIMVVAAMAHIIWAIRRSRALPFAWGLLWFGAAMVPQTGVLIPVNALFLEHWMYLPTMGLSLGLAQNLASRSGIAWHRVHQVLAVCAALLAVVYGVMTLDQSAVWRDAFTFYPYILERESTAVRILTNLGKAYYDRGENEKSLQYYAAAARVSDKVPELHENIAATLSHMPGWENHPEEVIRELNRALELDPQFLPALDGLEYVYGVTGDKDRQAIYKQKADLLRRKMMPQN